MFVYTLSSKLIKRVLLSVLAVCFIISALVLYKCMIEKNITDNTAEMAGSEIASSSGILSFISSLGWEVREEPDEVREVVIPAEFDEVYNSYNSIQKKQGYDLTDYTGERVKRWTYTVLNYPEYEDEEFIKINILICDDKVIGGDVCSVRLDGFMHGFSKE